MINWQYAVIDWEHGVIDWEHAVIDWQYVFHCQSGGCKGLGSGIDLKLVILMMFQYFLFKKKV